MKTKSLIKITLSLILALSLVITTVTISPRVASAQDVSNEASSALLKGMDFNDQGDPTNAELSLKQAIELATPNVKLFITAKKLRAEIKKSQGKIEEANKLNQEAEAGITALGQPPTAKIEVCGDCGDRLEWSFNRCTRCF